MDLGSPSRRGAIIRSSLIKLREMSKDSTMPARRTMRTQIITSLGRPVLLSSTSSTSTCVRVYVYTSHTSLPLSYLFCAALDPSFSKSTSTLEIIHEYPSPPMASQQVVTDQRNFPAVRSPRFPLGKFSFQMFSNVRKHCQRVYTTLSRLLEERRF